MEVLRGPDFYVVSGGGVGDFNIIKGKVRSHLSVALYFCKLSITLIVLLLSIVSKTNDWCVIQSTFLCYAILIVNENIIYKYNFI